MKHSDSGYRLWTPFMLRTWILKVVIMKPGFIVHAYNLRIWEVPEEGSGFHILSLCSVFCVMSHPWKHKEFEVSLGYMSLCLKMNKQNQQNKKWAWEGDSVAKYSGAFPGDLGSALSTHTVSHAIYCSSSKKSDTLVSPPEATGLHEVHGHVCKQDTHTHKIFLFIFKIKIPKAKNQKQSNRPHKLKW